MAIKIPKPEECRFTSPTQVEFTCILNAIKDRAELLDAAKDMIAHLHNIGEFGPSTAALQKAIAKAEGPE